MKPAKIMLIRHAEKPPQDGGAPFGIDDDGNQDDHSLTVRGWTRSGALTQYFSTAHGRIAPPDHLFGAAYDVQPGSRHGKRAVQTLAALAAAQNRPLDTSFTVGDEGRLCAALQDAGGTVLVAWEHRNIPLIARGIMGEAAFAEEWPERFDLVWVFDATPAGYDFSSEDQHVLNGDA